MGFVAGAAQYDLSDHNRTILSDEVKKIKHQLPLLGVVELAEDFAEVGHLGLLVLNLCIRIPAQLDQRQSEGSSDKIVPRLHPLERLEGGREHLSETQDGENIIVRQKLLHRLGQLPELDHSVRHRKMFVCTKGATLDDTERP